MSTFLSDAAPGENLQEAIAKAMGEARVHVILATATYGRHTNMLYSTRQEMNFIMESGRPFLVNMTTPPSQWEEPATVLALTGLMWMGWEPGASLPDELVHRVLTECEA